MWSSVWSGTKHCLMNKLRFLTLTIVMIATIIISCREEDAGPKIFDMDYMSHIYPENFVSTINNPFLVLTPGSTFIYTGETEEGTERVEIEVLSETRTVMGITCVVVRDRAFLENELIEDTYDWFAQDKDGNVWYFGEHVDNYEDGVVANHYGSWEAGVDGAQPGIIMLGNPVIGLHYRQELYIGEAEDEGEVVSKNESVTVPAGTFSGCLKIKETNPLDPESLEYKYYANGVGLVWVEKIQNPVETEELISFNIK
jgi:hypothetical protein